MSVEIEVQQGQVHLNSVWCVMDGPGFVVLEADLRAKYAVIGCFAEDAIHLGAGDGTLHREAADEPTILRVRAFPKQSLDATVSRYTLRIYVVEERSTNEPVVLWTDSDRNPTRQVLRPERREEIRMADIQPMADPMTNPTLPAAEVVRHLQRVVAYGPSNRYTFSSHYVSGLLHEVYGTALPATAPAEVLEAALEAYAALRAWLVLLELFSVVPESARTPRMEQFATQAQSPDTGVSPQRLEQFRRWSDERKLHRQPEALHMRFRPISDHLLLKRQESEEKVGHIIVPDAARVKSTKAEVMAVGPGKWVQRGPYSSDRFDQPIPLALRPPEVKVGDVVVLGKYAGADVELDGEKYVVVEEGEVLGVEVKP